MKEAYLYQSKDNRVAVCALCSHRCHIRSGEKGLCEVRQNDGGTLLALSYGKVIAVHVDPVEKKPLYHFLPGQKAYSVAAAGCNFRCGFCQNWRISQLSKDWQGDFPGQKLSPREIIEQALAQNCPVIAYTYTEPTVFFEYAFDTACLANKREIRNVFVTNGYQTPETIEKMTGVIEAANIDLKSFRDKYYREVCGARLEPVLESIRRLKQAGLWIEITTLVVPGRNDSTEELEDIAAFIAEVDQDIPWHLSRFYPNYQMSDGQPTPLDKLEEAAEIGRQAGLNYIYLGNVPGESYSDTVCPGCQKVVIERRGYKTTSYLEQNQCPECQETVAGVFE